MLLVNSGVEVSVCVCFQFSWVYVEQNCWVSVLWILCSPHLNFRVRKSSCRVEEHLKFHVLIISLCRTEVLCVLFDLVFLKRQTARLKEGTAVVPCFISRRGPHSLLLKLEGI